MCNCLGGGQFTERVSAKGKVAVVSGANTGIGRETARELNLRGAKASCFVHLRKLVLRTTPHDILG